LVLAAGCKTPEQAAPSELASAEPPERVMRTPAMEFRERLLTGTPSRFGIDQPGPVWAVVEEVLTKRGTIGVVALADGHTTNYSTSGTTGAFFSIRSSAREAAVRACALAAEHVDQAAATKDFPYPVTGRIRYFFLTPSGPRTIDVGRDELRCGDHSF